MTVVSVTLLESLDSNGLKQKVTLLNETSTANHSSLWFSPGRWKTRPTDEESYVSGLNFISTEMWTPKQGDELNHVKPPLFMLGMLKVVKVHSPLTGCQPCTALWVWEILSDGRPRRWSVLSVRRPPDVPASREVCRSFGAQVSPHLHASCWHVELLPLKGFGVYVEAYGITLSSVASAKHDSNSRFLNLD